MEKARWYLTMTSSKVQNRIYDKDKWMSKILEYSFDSRPCFLAVQLKYMKLTDVIILVKLGTKSMQMFLKFELQEEQKRRT